MSVIGGGKNHDREQAESETTKKAEIGIAVEWELQRYRQTLADIDRYAAARKLSAQGMFASRIEAIVQRISPLVSGPSPTAEPEGDSPE